MELSELQTISACVPKPPFLLRLRVIQQPLHQFLLTDAWWQILPIHPGGQGFGQQ